MNNKYLPLGIDLFFSLVLLPAMIALLPVERWLVNNSTFVLILVAWLYTVYFLMRKACVPLLFRSNRQVIIALCILTGTLVVTWFITQYQMEFPFRGDHPRAERMRRTANLSKIRLHQQATWFLYLVTLCFSIAVGLLTELYKQMTVRQNIEFEKKKAELALYKAQINPHFLFNTLNTLYGLILINSDKAESAFIKFSNILKYMYLQTNADTIPLSTEIDYLKQFIDLQSLRLNKHTKVFFENNTEGCQMSIPPMLLITFVENAFKYGASSNTDCTISIRINAENGVLQFETENKIIKKSEKDSPSIGIDNCRKRLQLLYSGRFSLKTEQIDDTFKTFLTIKMNP